jgi:hypothetical protein
MKIGTGVFLGLSAIAVVLLYGQTKERWKWARIAKWALAITLGPIVIGASWFTYTAAKARISNWPHRVNTYEGVPLGATKQDVLYGLGAPTAVEAESAPGESFPGRYVYSVADLKNGKTYLDYQYWEYSPITVTFDANVQRVSDVACFALQGATCPPLLGIKTGESEEEVISYLGNPSSSRYTDDWSGVKMLTFEKWNTSFLLSKHRVYGFELGILRWATKVSRTAPPSFRASAPSSAATRGVTGVGTSPPTACGSARNAKECAKILEKAGNNPFAAFGTVGHEPVYPDDARAPN